MELRAPGSASSRVLGRTAQAGGAWALTPSSPLPVRTPAPWAAGTPSRPAWGLGRLSPRRPCSSGISQTALPFASRSGSVVSGGPGPDPGHLAFAGSFLWGPGRGLDARMEAAPEPGHPPAPQGIGALAGLPLRPRAAHVLSFGDGAPPTRLSEPTPVPAPSSPTGRRLFEGFAAPGAHYCSGSSYFGSLCSGLEAEVWGLSPQTLRAAAFSLEGDVPGGGGGHRYFR